MPHSSAKSALWINLILFAIAMIAAGIKAYFTYSGSAVSEPGAPPVEQAVIDVFLAFCALELAYLIIRVHRLQDAAERASIELRDRNARDSVIARLDERIRNIHDTLEVGDPVHSSVAKAAFRPLEDFSIVPSGITIETEQLTIAFYAEFWKELVKRQLTIGSRAKYRALTIYTTHSASIRLWQRPEFAEVRALQDQFVGLGGIVNRILVNQSKGLETVREYEEVVAEMTRNRAEDVASDRFNMYYFERENRDAISDDFLLVVLDEKPYCAMWETNWDGQYGSILKCRIHTDHEHFSNYWWRWCLVVNEAVNWQPPETLKDSALFKRPSAKIAKSMTHPPLRLATAD